MNHVEPVARALAAEPRLLHATERRLGAEWQRILVRDVKWKMAYSAVLKEKGGLHEHDRKRAKVGTGY